MASQIAEAFFSEKPEYRAGFGIWELATSGGVGFGTNKAAKSEYLGNDR